MKSLKLAIILFIGVACFSGCDKTEKSDVKTKSADTIVMKKDTAIKRTDTAGYNK